MDLTYVFCPNIIGLLSLTLLLVFTRFNYYLDRKKLNLFSVSAIINMAMIVLGLMDYLFSIATFPTAYLFRRITTATGFALSPIFPLFISHINNPKPARWVYIPATVNVFLCYASIFTGHMFYIGQWNSYSRGPLFPVMFGISIFYLLLILSTSFLKLKRARPGELWLLVLITLILLSANLLEIIVSFHFLIWNTCAVLLVCYYLFLHIQYFKLDPLSGVFNRNVFASDLDNLKNKSDVGIVSFDLDKLKRVNDKEGHEKGDEYILKAAQLMDRCFSDLGKVYRIGGDEFVVLASDTTENTMVERIKAFDQECLDNQVLISCGYSFSHLVADAQKLLRDSDTAMYENKRLKK